MTLMPMGDLLRYHAERLPADAIALDYPEARFTWSELDAATNRRARHYQSLGVTSGDRVIIALGNGTAFHEAAFAVWKLGATPATLSPTLSPAEFGALVALVEPKLVIKAPRPDDMALGVATVAGDVDISGYSETPLASQAAAIWKLSSSGGSTGRPKVIVHDSPALFDPDANRVESEFLLRPGSVLLNPGPLYHNAPFLFSSYALFTGSKVVGMARFDAEETLRRIEAERVNWVNLVPTMMHRIWMLPDEVRTRYDLSSLETVWHMASACPAWLKKSWIEWLGPHRIWERYGGSEGFGSTVISGADWLSHQGAVGKPINNVQMKIVRDDGTLCATGEVGELYFRPASGKAPAYYIGADLRSDADGFYTMGDLGHIDADGFVYLADRRTDLIVRGGANIYPAEVEAALDAYPDIASSIVIGLPDDALGARIHAIVEPRPGTTLDLADLHRFAGGQLAKYKHPESYEIAFAPLRDEAGKARRTALRDERIARLEAEDEFRVDARSLSSTGAAAA